MQNIRASASVGMTLIEILITIMIMAITAAITVPSIMDLRRTGSEARAAASLKGELMPACLQFQQMYDATRDYDQDQLGDFPLHPACLVGARAGLVGSPIELATTAAAITTDLLDRKIWGNATGMPTSSFDITNQHVNLRLPNSTTDLDCRKGTLVESYTFGFLTGGTPDLYYSDYNGGYNNDRSMRDVMITVFAAPNSATTGRHFFAMSLNPFFYRGMVAQSLGSNLPLGTQYPMWYLAQSGTSTAMFTCPAGMPPAAIASAATGGVSIPGIFGLKNSSQMR